MRLRLNVPIEEIGKLRHCRLSLACAWPSGHLNQGCLASESGFITTTFFRLQDPGLQHPPVPRARLGGLAGHPSRGPRWAAAHSALRGPPAHCPLEQGSHVAVSQLKGYSCRHVIYDNSFQAVRGVGLEEGLFSSHSHIGAA